MLIRLLALRESVIEVCPFAWWRRLTRTLPGQAGKAARLDAGRCVCVCVYVYLGIH